MRQVSVVCFWPDNNDDKTSTSSAGSGPCPLSLPRPPSMPPASRRRSSPGEKPHRPPSNVFKPKFPLDPFAAANVREPWFIRPDTLPSPHANPRRDVLLVLGCEHSILYNIIMLTRGATGSPLDKGLGSSLVLQTTSKCAASDRDSPTTRDPAHGPAYSSHTQTA